MKLFVAVLSLCSSSWALADQFNVDEMPVGAEVTLPGAAKTMIPMATRVKFGSTDSPQTIRIMPVPVAGSRPVPVNVTIYDAKQERVKYVQVAPGSPFLYSFKGLSSITLHTDVPQTTAAKKTSVRLQIESDKPLTVAR